MTTTTNASAAPFEIDDARHENNDHRSENQTVTAGVMVADRPLPERMNWTGALPASSFSVMVVVNDNGYFQSLYTAGDLFRWCKSTWRTEQD
jgi:hypothetical protein